MTADLLIENGRVVTPRDVLDPGQVVVADGRIRAVEPDGTERSASRRVDADGRLVLPGLVDLHGDDVERHLFPRPRARVPTEEAITACDRANAAAGITTKFHAVAFEEDPDGHRSLALAEELVDAVHDATATTVIDHRVHARCELGDDGSVSAVGDCLDRPRVDVVSLVNHLPGRGQYADRQAFDRRYVDGGSVVDQREREGLTDQRRAAGDGRAARVCERAKATGTAIASHDDEHPSAVERADSLGVSVSEFPVTMPAARRARELGLTTAMGAPNLVRGGSLWGNLSAANAVDAGVVDVLCSDYRPGALLEGVLVDTGEPLPERVARASAAPADAVGLSDRGRLAPGARADIVVVDVDPRPTVRHAFVAGEAAYRARPRRT